MNYAQAVKWALKRAARARTPDLIRWISRYTLTREYSGRSIQIPIIGDVNPDQFFEHEPQVDAILSTLPEQYSGAFIDVGANTGQTLLKVVAASPGRRYVGFDASIFCAHYVDRLIKLNGFQNCTILPIGLADGAFVIDLQYSREADGGATIIENFWSGNNVKPLRQSISVQCGDTALSCLSLDSIAAVKIDVEGGELEVLLGLKETLARFKPPIVVEILPYSCDDTGSDETRIAVATRRERMERLRASIVKLDYSAHRLMPDGSIALASEFDAAVYDPRMTNYPLLHAHRLQDLTYITAKYKHRLVSQHNRLS